MQMKSKVGTKGQAVIPKPVRDALGIQPGDEVYYSLHDGHAHIETDLRAARRRFFESLPTKGKGRGLKPGELRKILDEQYDDLL